MGDNPSTRQIQNALADGLDWLADGLTLTCLLNILFEEGGCIELLAQIRKKCCKYAQLYALKTKPLNPDRPGNFSE